MAGRYVKMTPRPGEGTALAQLMLEVAGSLAQLGTDAGKAKLGDVMALLAGPPERIDLEPLGGVGLPA